MRCLGSDVALNSRLVFFARLGFPTEEALRAEVVRNYKAFMLATEEIRSMETGIQTLKDLLVSTSATLQVEVVVDRIELGSDCESLGAFYSYCLAGVYPVDAALGSVDAALGSRASKGRHMLLGILLDSPRYELLGALGTRK